MPYILTFDDGPTTDALEKIDYLNQLGIKSIWFCLGENIRQNPEAAEYALETGHLLGNHSYSHPHFSEISLSEAEQQIVETEQLLNDVYMKAGIARPQRLFRFPYGDQGQNTDRELSQDPVCIARKQELQQLLSRLGMTGPRVEAYDYEYPFVNAPADHDWLWSYDIQEWAIHYDNPAYHLTAGQVAHNLGTYLAAPKSDKH